MSDLASKIENARKEVADLKAQIKVRRAGLQAKKGSPFRPCRTTASRKRVRGEETVRRARSTH